MTNTRNEEIEIAQIHKVEYLNRHQNIPSMENSNIPERQQSNIAKFEGKNF